MTRSIFRAFGCVFLCVGLLAGCSSSRDTVDREPDDLPTPTFSDVDVVAYESFDASADAEDEPEIVESIQHDVPEPLMRSRAGSSARRSVQGFRVQVYSAQAKTDADEQLQAVLDWWETIKTSDDVPATYRGRDLPVYVVYKQPYYRVRVGDYTSRPQADQLLSLIDDAFPQAFIVPDEVSVAR